MKREMGKMKKVICKINTKKLEIKKKKKKITFCHHKFTHTGEKPFACDYEGCDYKCSESLNDQMWCI